jgi:formimidoylglutamate deiminase
MSNANTLSPDLSPARSAGERRLLWAPAALLDGQWKDSVLFEIGVDGCWASVQAGVFAPTGAQVVRGPVVSGMVDAHSHAFQRAFAGLAEQRQADRDDFWSWRDRMYRVAGRIDGARQRAIAAHLYHELLRGGYTQVCEFQYLHHRGGAQREDGGFGQATALLDAARSSGIGITLLPTVYERAGFLAPALREDQGAFRAGAKDVLALHRALAPELGANARLGLAVHSLRAATPESIAEVANAGVAGPIHVHAAEQVLEVEQCLAATGLRPIEWLGANVPLDARWHLVHATHALPSEIETVARAGAGVVLCPSTEANLGDGVADLPGWLAGGVGLSIGTDSHMTRSIADELRLLEYSQRLFKRARCVAADPARGLASTGARLWDAFERGGAAPAGFARWGLREGARADLLVIDIRSSALAGVPREGLIDAVVFSTPGRPFRDVMVAGQWVVRDHGAEGAAKAAREFREVMTELWAQS